MWPLAVRVADQLTTGHVTLLYDDYKPTVARRDFYLVSEYLEGPLAIQPTTSYVFEWPLADRVADQTTGTRDTTLYHNTYRRSNSAHTTHHDMTQLDSPAVLIEASGTI